MLVETCSSIGQELNKSSKQSDVSLQFESGKSRTFTSPPGKATSPPHSHSVHQRLTSIGAGVASLTSRQPGALHNNNKHMPASAQVAAQYQLMYQQLLYQAEMEYLQNRGREARDTSTSSSSSSPVAPKPVHETQISAASLKPACGVCSLAPGYVKGQCIHENPSSFNHMLAMLNPGSSAAAILAYSSKLASLNKPVTESASRIPPPPGYPSKGWEASRASPPSRPHFENRKISPRHSPLPADLPMDLQLQKCKSPSSVPTGRLIECHWVGAEGYCGKRFSSHDDMMKHLKIHVITCPNVVTSDEDTTTAKLQQNLPSRQKSTSPPSDNLLRSAPSKALPSFLNKRFNPYSLTDGSYPSMLLTPR